MNSSNKSASKLNKIKSNNSMKKKKVSNKYKNETKRSLSKSGEKDYVFFFFYIYFNII